MPASAARPRLDIVGQAVDGEAAAAALHPGAEGLGHQPRAGGRGDAVGVGERPGAEGVAAEEEHRRLAGAEDAGGVVERGVGDGGGSGDAKRALDHAAFAP